jgi:hypothetical protein
MRLMAPFITRSDFLMDGGVSTSYCYWRHPRNETLTAARYPLSNERNIE